MLFHYYGDIVRRLFLGGGTAMLLTLPFFHQFLPVPDIVSLLIIATLALIAGFISPAQKWGNIMAVVLASLAVVVFGYEAIATYTLSCENECPDLLFWINIGLAINFLFALYYSTKTLRATLERKR